MVGGVASPAGEQATCPLRGELKTLKAPTSPEAEEGSCWDQEADLVLCALWPNMSRPSQIWTKVINFDRNFFYVAILYVLQSTPSRDTHCCKVLKETHSMLVRGGHHHLGPL